MTARATMRTGELNRLLKAAKERGEGVELTLSGRFVRFLPWGQPKPKPPIPDGQFIYVARVQGFDLVKIGFSRNVERRLRELNWGSGMKGGIVELARFPGTMKTERELHRRFAEQRLFGEWFALTGPITEWLSELEAAA